MQGLHEDMHAGTPCRAYGRCRSGRQETLQGRHLQDDVPEEEGQEGQEGGQAW